MTTESSSIDESSISIREARLVSPYMLLQGIKFACCSDVHQLKSYMTPIAGWRQLNDVVQIRILHSKKHKAIEIGIRVNGDSRSDYAASVTYRYGTDIKIYSFKIAENDYDYIVTEQELRVYSYDTDGVEYTNPVDLLSPRDADELDFYVTLMHLPVPDRMKDFILSQDLFDSNNIPVLKEYLQEMQGV